MSKDKEINAEIEKLMEEMESLRAIAIATIAAAI